MIDHDREVSDSIRDMLRDDADKTSPEEMKLSGSDSIGALNTWVAIAIFCGLLTPVGLLVMFGNLAGGLVLTMIGITGVGTSIYFCTSQATEFQRHADQCRRHG